MQCSFYEGPNMAKRKRHYSMVAERDSGEYRKEGVHYRRDGEYLRNDTMENYRSEGKFNRSDANGNYRRAKDMESREGGMINDDWNAPSLLPRMVIDKYYGTDYHYVEQTQPDLYTGVEKQLKMDREAFRREFYPHKE